MDIFTMILGIFCIGYGIFSIIMRIKSPEKFGKLGAMKEKFGEKTGMLIHIVSYTVVPILTGVALLVGGVFGISFF